MSKPSTSLSSLLPAVAHPPEAETSFSYLSEQSGLIEKSQHPPANKLLASSIGALVQSHSGVIDTELSGVRLLATTQGQKRTPLIYDPGIIVIVQGNKIGYLGERTIHYGPGNYLVQTLPLPFECETHASIEEPLLGLYISFDLVMLSELSAYTAGSPPKGALSPMAAATLDADMQDSLLRLINCLGDPLKRRALGQGRIREVIFAALQGPYGDSIRQLVQGHGQYARVIEALNYINLNYAQMHTVESLAARVNMSVSHFHHHFKNATQLSPLQYLKRLRLFKARSLLHQKQMNVARAAREVGYRSASQFSREFTRYFGINPSQG